MANIANLLTEHMAIWTAAETEKKSGRGRAGGNTGSVYGVKKLRELILELAMRGKLVPQDPSDEPASELLKRIHAEKSKLIAEGKIKKEKPLAPIGEVEKPFELPKGWEWVSIQEVTMLITDGTHHTPNYIDSGIPFISVKDINGQKISFEDCKFISQKEHQEINARCNPEIDDILLCRIGTLGRPTIVDTNLSFSLFVSVGLLKLPKTVKIQNYLHKVLSSPMMYEQYDNIKAGGSHTNKLNLGDIPKLLIPLPSANEQHRIIAKINSLMALCDQLEQQHSNAQQAHETLVSQLLATLTQCQNAADFNANWQRIYAHFDVLFSTEASIDTLKKTLLQLAVMGKLVQQDPNDEPASKLLKRIQAEKSKLITEGKLKKEKPLAPIAEDEKPFELPKGWEWSKVLDCSVFVTDGEHATPQRTSDGKIPLVTAKNVRDGYMNYEDTDFVNISVAEKCWKRCKPEQSDLLMVSVGATLGRLTVLEEARDMVIVRSVTLIRPCLLSPLYLSLAIKSPLVQEAIWGSVRQMAQPGLYLAQSSNLVIPIAPLAEQQRIVAKVDALLALCDQLKTRIQQANQQQQAIADALVAQALKPATAEIIDLATYRSTVACHIFKRMQNNHAFGRTFAMKLLYLSQQHIGFEMHLEFERKAAGPFNEWIYDFEGDGVSAGWFGLVEKQLFNGNIKIEYQVKSAIDEPLAMIDSVGSAVQRKELDRLFSLFADKKTEEAEISATLFAAWNDFLIDGKSPTDDEIVQEVRENWHESKAKFSPAQLKEWLGWMRKNQIVPQGRLPRTLHQQRLNLH